MSIKGRPRQWFEAALAAGNGASAWSEAFALEHVSLDDAARLVLLLEPGSATFDRAAVRWLGRLLVEVRGLTRAEAQLAAAAVGALPAPAALEAFGAVCARAGLDRAAEDAARRARL